MSHTEIESEMEKVFLIAKIRSLSKLREEDETQRKSLAGSFLRSMGSKKQGRYFRLHFYVGTEILGPQALWFGQRYTWVHIECSKQLNEPCIFCVWADWAILGRTETAQKSQSMLLLRAGFSCFQGQKIIKVFLNKLRKLSISFFLRSK